MVYGDGADIGGSADSFYYLYMPLRGDGELTAFVMGMVDTDPWAKAGVMIRETLTPGSRHATRSDLVAERNGVSAAHGHGRRLRLRPGQWVQGSRTGSESPGAGNVFSGYYSPNGVSWAQQGTEAIAMAQDAYIGMCVTSHARGHTVRRGVRQRDVREPDEQPSEGQDARRQLLRSGCERSSTRMRRRSSIPCACRCGTRTVSWPGSTARKWRGRTSRARLAGTRPPAATAPICSWASRPCSTCRAHKDLLRDGRNVLGRPGTQRQQDESGLPDRAGAGCLRTGQDPAVLRHADARPGQCLRRRRSCGHARAQPRAGLLLDVVLAEHLLRYAGGHDPLHDGRDQADGSQRSDVHEARSPSVRRRVFAWRRSSPAGCRAPCRRTRTYSSTR